MTVPRWLRQHRRAQRSAVRPARDPLRRTAADVRRDQGVPAVPLEAFRGREPLPDEEWEPFIAAVREAKGW